MTYIDLLTPLRDRMQSIKEIEDQYVGRGKVIECAILLPVNVIEELSLDSDDDLKHIIEIKKAKTKLNSISEISKIADIIVSTLKDKNDGVLNEWVEYLKNIHWRVTDSLGNISYFKPISETIGTNTVGKLYDTQTVGIVDPKLNKDKKRASYYRKSIQQKLISDHARIETDYTNINLLFKDQINFNITPDEEYKNKLEKVKDDIKKILENLLDDAIRLIKYLYPNGRRSAEIFIVPSDPDSLLPYPENKIFEFRHGLNLLKLGPIPRPNTTDESVRPNVIINFRGDKKPEIIKKKINNSVIEPIIKEE